MANLKFKIPDHRICSHKSTVQCAADVSVVGDLINLITHGFAGVVNIFIKWFRQL